MKRVKIFREVHTQGKYVKVTTKTGSPDALLLDSKEEAEIVAKALRNLKVGKLIYGIIRNEINMKTVLIAVAVGLFVGSIVGLLFALI